AGSPLCSAFLAFDLCWVDLQLLRHQAVVLLSLAIVAVIGVLLMFPELRRGKSSRPRRTP
ncbi:unnamed protein product, partial [Symbiodinium microadriaticum]